MIATSLGLLRSIAALGVGALFLRLMMGAALRRIGAGVTSIAIEGYWGDMLVGLSLRRWVAAPPVVAI